MSHPITAASAVSAYSATVSTASAGHTGQARSANTPVSPSTDKIELSVSALITALRKQGENADSIAANLGVPEAVVDSQLGIPTVSDPVTLAKQIAALITSAS